jgi:MFS transporter, ACS family, solute carrier family 17 (sodium-dependent inorganic phosphate cotransporter), member 5
MLFPTQSGTFNWNSKQQGVVLAAFFYGYITTQIIGGTLAQRIGGKYLLLFGIFWTALLTLLTPIATTAGDYGAIVAVRLLEGIGEVNK